MTGPGKDHGKLEQLLHLALDGVLAPGQARTLDAHLAECDDCAFVLTTIEAAAAAWKTQPGVQLTTSARLEIGNRVMRQVEQIEPGAHRPARIRRRPLGRMAAAAAVIAAAVAAVWLVVPDRTEELPDREPAPAGSLASRADRTAKGARARPTPDEPSHVRGVSRLLAGRATITRPGHKPAPVTDGAPIGPGDLVMLEEAGAVRIDLARIGQLLLRRGAVMSYDSSGDRVALNLKRGLVAARVDGGGSGAFSVTTPGGIVEITGTVFQVEVEPNAQMRVAVVEGTVLVRDPADERNVIAVSENQTMEADWSNPKPRRLGKRQRALILKQLDDHVGAAAEHRPGSKSRAERRVGRAKSWENLFEQATEARLAGQSKEAIAIYTLIVDQAPNRPHRAEAAFTLAQLRFSQGDWQGAEADLVKHEALLTGTRYKPMSLFYLVKARIKLGKKRQALEAIEEFMRIAPDHRLAKRIEALRLECL